jgi:hypothetical protein
MMARVMITMIVPALMRVPMLVLMRIAALRATRGIMLVLVRGFAHRSLTLI